MPCVLQFVSSIGVLGRVGSRIEMLRMFGFAPLPACGLGTGLGARLATWILNSPEIKTVGGRLDLLFVDPLLRRILSVSVRRKLRRALICQ